MTLLPPKYISYSEIQNIFHSRLNQIILDSLAEELPEIETELIANIAAKDSQIILEMLTESIEDVINQKINNIVSRRVGW